MDERQKGQALLSVVSMLVVLTMTAWAFVSLTQAELKLAGQWYRKTAALLLAEAGVEQALWELVSIGRGDGDKIGRLAGFQDQLGSGRFAIEEIREEQPGVVTVVARGEMRSAVRRIRRTVRIAPRALAHSLFGGEVVLAGKARTYAVRPKRNQGACDCLGHVAVARRLWLEAGVTLNALDGRRISARDPGLADYELYGFSDLPDHPSRISDVLPDLILIGDAKVAVENRPWTFSDLLELRREVPGVFARSLRGGAGSVPPVDAEAYQALATANRANASINRAVGNRVLDRDLAEKQDSLYTEQQFAKMLGHLATFASERADPELRLNGVVFVDGMVTISRPVRIEDGALIARGRVHLTGSGRLEVRHSADTTHLPGVIAYGEHGVIRLSRDAVLIVDGLVLGSVGLEVLKADVDVLGTILAGQGVLNEDGRMVIRYQPDVLQTIGLKRTEHVLIHPLSWREEP